MEFWRLAQPHYSDYEAAHINGALEHPYGLPGVHCDVCAQTWSYSRNLPYVCPERLRSTKGFTNPWPVPRADHEALQTQLMRELSIDGHPFVDFRPGDDLQPCFLDVPTRP